MNGYQKRTERKKENIRQAAKNLFSKYGIDKVSVSDIAQLAGVSHVTIYNYFGSKDGLVSDLIKTRFISQLQRLQEIVQSGQTFTEKLETLLLDKVHTITPFDEEMTQKALVSNPELRSFFETVLKKDMPKLYLEIIDAGIEDGFIDPNIPPETILMYLYLIRAGAIADPERWAKFHLDEKSGRDFQNLILYGLKGKRDTSGPGRT